MNTSIYDAFNAFLKEINASASTQTGPYSHTTINGNYDQVKLWDGRGYCYSPERKYYIWCDVAQYFQQVKPIATWTTIALGILLTTIVLLAVIGNALVIWIWKTTRTMKTVINKFIVNLAISDIILALIFTPFQFYAGITQRWDMPVVMCKVCPFSQVLAFTASVYTLVVISFEKCRVVMDPMGSKLSHAKANLAICIIWMVSFVFALPTAYYHKVEYVPEANQNFTIGFKPFCNPFGSAHRQHDKMSNKNSTSLFDGSGSTNYQIYTIGLVFFQFVIPYIIMVTKYLRMCVRLWTSTTPGNSDENRDSAILKNKKKSVIMMVTVMIVFGICWSPWHAYNLMTIFLKPMTISIANQQFLFFLSYAFAMSNSCINPFIYAICCDKFQKEFKHKLKWKTIKRLLTGERSISRIEEEVAMIPLNNGKGQVLSSGLRAHRVGPKCSEIKNVLITDIQDVSPEKENDTAIISYMGTYV